MASYDVATLGGKMDVKNNFTHKKDLPYFAVLI